MSKKIQIIIGSNRPNRSGMQVALWAATELQNKFSDLDVEVIDLKEVNLPFLDEPQAPSKGDYQHEHTIKWAKRIASADGFIFISPEYNGGYTAVLKNAIDTIYAEWQDKPAAVVSYGASSGMKSADQLIEVVNHLGMKGVKSRVGISQVWAAFEDGKIVEDKIDGSIDEVLEELNSLLRD